MGTLGKHWKNPKQSERMIGDLNPAKRLDVRKRLRDSKIGDLNPAKRLDVREKISKGVEEVWKDPVLKEKQRESHTGENNYEWKGGLYNYWHEKARELFETKNCEECGISLEEYLKIHKKKFHMHCISKDYTIIEQWNWKNICCKCHRKTY